MSKNDQRKKFNRQMSDSRKAIEAFAKLDQEKYIKKNKKWCGGKKEAREYFCYELEDSLPGTIMFIMMQGYVNKPEIKELKNKAFGNIIRKSFVKHLIKVIDAGQKIENIDYLPIIIKEILETINKTNQQLLAEDPNTKAIIQCDDLIELSSLILKKKIKKMKKKGIDERIAFDVLSIIPNKKVMELYRSSKLFRMKSLMDCMYEHAKTKEVPFANIIDICLGRDYYPAMIAFALLERKEKFGNLNESQKKFYLQVSTWCFDTLEKELSKNEIQSVLETYVSTRKRDELNNRDGNRRYALMTLSEADYPKIRKIMNEMVVQDESIRKYL